MPRSRASRPQPTPGGGRASRARYVPPSDRASRAAVAAKRESRRIRRARADADADGTLEASPQIFLDRRNEEKQAVRSTRARRMAPMAGEYQIAEKDLMGDAAAYLACLYNPEGEKPARVPDLLSYPTAVCVSVNTFNFTSVANGSYYDLDALFNPSVNGNKVYQTTAYAAGVGTATVNYEDALYNAAVLNWDRYRTVAMSVEIIPTSAVTTINGLCQAALIADGPALVGASLAATLSGVPDRCEWQLFATSSDSRLRLVWHPATYATGLDMLPVGGLLGVNPAIYFSLRGSAVQTVTFKVTTVYEFVPLYTAQALFDTKACVGDMSKVAIVESMIEENVAVSTRNPRFGELATSFLKDAGRAALGAVGDAARLALPGLGGAIKGIFSKWLS